MEDTSLIIDALASQRAAINNLTERLANVEELARMLGEDVWGDDDPDGDLIAAQQAKIEEQAATINKLYADRDSLRAIHRTMSNKLSLIASRVQGINLDNLQDMRGRLWVEANSIARADEVQS
ncbi:hypothetical protein ACXY7D_11975 [Sphingomonas melonis]